MLNPDRWLDFLEDHEADERYRDDDGCGSDEDRAYDEWKDRRMEEGDE